MREIGLWGEFLLTRSPVILHQPAHHSLHPHRPLFYSQPWNDLVEIFFGEGEKVKRKSEMKGYMKWKPAHLDVDSSRRLRRYVSSGLFFFWTRWMDFSFLYEIHGYSSSFNARGRNARLCFFQSERGCGPKSCNDRFSPVFSCARGPAIRAPFPRDRPVLIPPSPARARSRWGARTAPERLTSRGRTWERARRC